MTKCPKCGVELVVEFEGCIRHCNNETCKGWFCFYCDKWHPYGTRCTDAALWYDNVIDQQSYDNWCKEHKEDIRIMLRDSGNWDNGVL